MQYWCSLLDEKNVSWKKIHAELLDNNIDVRTLNTEVPEPGSVEIDGAVASKEEKNRTVEIVKNVNGIF